MNIEEIRKWYVTVSWTIVILLVVLAPLVAYHEYEVNKLDTENRILSKKIQSLITELQKKPTVKVIYVKVPLPGQTVTQTVYIQTPPPAVQVTKDLYCKTARENGVEPTVDINNGNIRCVADICNNSGTITVSQAAINEIKKAVHRGIWQPSLTAGYEFDKSAFSLGFSALNWNGLIAGINVASDFKTSERSEVGVFIGWRPVLRGWQSAFSIAVGPGYSFNRTWGVQALLQFHFLDKE